MRHIIHILYVSMYVKDFFGTLSGKSLQSRPEPGGPRTRGLAAATGVHPYQQYGMPL